MGKPVTSPWASIPFLIDRNWVILALSTDPGHWKDRMKGKERCLVNSEVSYKQSGLFCCGLQSKLLQVNSNH